MPRKRNLRDVAAGLLAGVSKAAVNEHNIVEVIRGAEFAMRSMQMTEETLDTFKVVRHVYRPSKTIPTVEVICEAVMALAQVRGIQQTGEDGKEVTIVGLEPDATYALYLCQIVDKAICMAWAEHKRTAAVKLLPPKSRSSYRRSFQRNLCGTIRGHITGMTADRFIAMKAADRMVLAKKRDIVAGSALEASE